MADKKKLPFFELLRQGWRPYLKLARYMKPYRGRFVFGLICGVAAGMLNGVFPLVVKVVGEKIFPSGQNPNTYKVLMSSGPDSGPGIEGVLWISLLIPVAMVARGIFSFLNGYCMAWVSFRVLQDLRTELFRHVISQSLEFFNKAKSGKLISRVLNDTRMAQNALTSIAGNIVKDPIAVIVGVCVLVVMDWRFSLTTLVLFPICIVPVMIFGKKVRKAGTAEENEAGTMAVILQESFAGVRVIKSFAREDYQIEQFDKSSAIQCHNSMKVRRSTDIVQPLIESVSACGVVLALFYVYYFNISFMKFIALCSGIFLLYNPLKSLSRIPMHMQKCLASTTNVFDLLHLKPAIQDAPNAMVLTECRGGITFRNVNFSYGQDTKALQDVNLEIEPGKQYALVGASGAGKTTMLSLILRFYDPQAGVIELDGRDLRTHHAAIASRTRRNRYSGYVSLSRHDLRKHPLRASRCHGGGDPRRRKAGFCPRFYPGSAGGLRHRSSATKAAFSQAVSSSGSPSRARCSRTRRCCYWMRRHRRSIPNRNA